MSDTDPRRGEVWVDQDGYEVLVVSNDAFNGSRMRDVVCLSVSRGDVTDEDDSPYAIVAEVRVGDFVEQRTVFVDDLMVLPKDELEAAVWIAPDDLMDEVAVQLEEILTPTAPTSHWPPWPSRHPRRTEIRYADLHLPGEGEKPVVVISSDEFSRRVGYVFVVACRVTSSAAPSRQYEVALRSQNGKVVCSHVQTVKRADLTYRQVKGGSNVTPGEADEIRDKVRALLGL